MDKETLSNYGWIVICILVLSVMIALATPFGQYVSSAVENTTQGLFDVNQSALGAVGIVINDNNFQENETVSNVITQADIDNSTGHLVAIGKTNPLYVIASFNDDFSHVDIIRNGTDSDGIMKSFEGLNSPMYEHMETLSSVSIDAGITSIGEYAFECCFLLTTVTIVDSVTFIGSHAFDGTCPPSIIFENTEGWWFASDINVDIAERIYYDVSDPEDVCHMFVGEWAYNCWSRS